MSLKVMIGTFIRFPLSVDITCCVLCICAFHIAPSDRGHDLNGAFLLPQLLAGLFGAFLEGSMASPQELIDLRFIHEFIEGFLKFPAFDNGMTILFMEFIVFSHVERLLGSRSWATGSSAWDAI